MSIPEKLLQVFADYDHYPVLENIRSGDYIDNIRPGQMKSSLMKGIDAYQRSFIAVKLFPRDLYQKMLKSYLQNHESCLTLVALSKTYYLPPDVARYIEGFIEYRPSSRSYSYDSDDEISIDSETERYSPPQMLDPQKFLTNQISVHTFFQRYTISGTEKSPFVHGEYSARCLARYRWKMIDINTLILLSNGDWHSTDGAYNPELELRKIVEGTHPISMIYNEKIERLINRTLS